MRVGAWSVASFAAFALALAADIAFADAGCTGHQLLAQRRPEGSCQTVAPQIFEAPDRALRALVFPADVSLDTTPDMESRIVIRSRAGDTVMSKDYSSPRGANGYYVDRAQWSPDAQFFVYSLMSSGGHSPWSHPIGIFARKSARFVAFSDMIDGRPTLSGDVTFTGPHTLTATTWRHNGALEDKIPVTVDLDAALSRLPPE
jgi:hypothetical protein